jgi:hypothetical protein
VGAKGKRGDPSIGNKTLGPSKTAIKEAEPTVEHASKWIDRDALAPYLQRIMDLPCWPDAEVQLMAGMPTADVARYIQKDREEAKWLTAWSLRTYLDALRNAAPPLWRIVMFGPQRGEQLAKRFGARNAMLHTLWEQIGELEVKVRRELAREELTGVNSESVLAMWGTMVKLIGQAHQIQKDLGLIVPEMPEGQGGFDVEFVQSVRARAGDAAAKALLDPAAQGRVLEALRRAMQAAGLPGSGLDTATDYQYRGVYGEAEEAGTDGEED